jgi:hypothetical protein
MRCLRFSLTAVLLAAVCTGVSVADPQNQNRPIGTNPNPVSGGGSGQLDKPIGANPYPVMPSGQTNKPVQTPVTRPVVTPQQPVGGTVDGTSYPYAHGVIMYDPYSGAYRYYSNGIGAIVYPPAYTSPDDSFGPQSMRRFIGADSRSRPKSSDDDETPEPKKTSERGTNSQSTTQAWKIIGFGDARFAEQKYLDANERYRSAARTAPQLADPLFRQGFALLAMGRYEPAFAAIKRGLKLDPKWAQSDFELKKLYGKDDEGKKDAHRETLAAASEAAPHDADLLFLLGLHLYFDGQAERAAKFFERARDVAPENAEYLKGFLAKP